MDIFARFFDQMSSLESTVFLLFLIVGFLLGVLLGQILKAKAMKKLQREQADAKAELISIKAKDDKREEEIERLKKAVEEGRQRVQQINDSYNRVDQENNRLRAAEKELRAEMEKHEQSVQSYVDTIDELQDQLLGLKTRNKDLEKTREMQPGEAVTSGAGQMGGLSQQMTQLEARMEELAEINRDMSNVIRRLQAPSQSISEHAFFPERSTTLQADSYTLLDLQAPEGDDLAKIRQVGPFLREKLRRHGIQTFQQIVELDATGMEDLARQLGYPREMIAAEDWVGQAKALMQSESNASSASNAQA